MIAAYCKDSSWQLYAVLSVIKCYTERTMVTLFLSSLRPDLHEIWHEGGKHDIWVYIQAPWQCCHPFDKTRGEGQAPSILIQQGMKVTFPTSYNLYNISELPILKKGPYIFVIPTS